MRNHSVISHTSRPLPYSGHPRDLRSKTRQLPLSGCPAPLPISGTRPPPRLKSTAFLFTASLFFLDPDLHPHVTHPSPSVRVSPATFPAPAHALILSPNLAWGRFPIHARHSDPPDIGNPTPTSNIAGPLHHPGVAPSSPHCSPCSWDSPYAYTPSLSNIPRNRNPATHLVHALRLSWRRSPP